jgi:hypothetical protein
MPSLWDAATVLADWREAVPVDDRHLVVRVGQHRRGKQPTDAAPQDHRVLTDPPHLAPPTS